MAASSSHMVWLRQVCLLLVLLVHSSTSAEDLEIRSLATGEESTGKKELQHLIQPQKSAEWFAGFADRESTYSDDMQTAFTGQLRLRAEHPAGVSPSRPAAINPSFFHESESGGQDHAWQSHYPALRGSSRDPWLWKNDLPGEWMQDYSPPVLHPDQRNLVQSALPRFGPEWFDAGVRHFDAFGRPRHPDVGATRSFFDWTERAVNTTLACADPGCSARAALQLYDPTTEEASKCHLSLHVHPTDFDDTASGERIEWVAASDRPLATDCFPQQSACVGDHSLPTISCLANYPVDVLVSEAGTLIVSAKISDVVDECAYDGNLLSAVAAATCLVRPRQDLNKGNLPDSPAEGALTTTPRCTQSQVTQIPLQCMTRGCTAEASAIVNASPASRCLLSVVLNQTDFDGDHGSLEVVEALNVSSTVLASMVQPGSNPCSCEVGPRPKPQSLPYIMLMNEDITSFVGADGLVELSAKISDLVDECPSNGYLLDAMAEVTCNLEC